MKKLTLLIVCLIAGMATAAAQSQGDKALGLNLNYASETSFGLGGKFQYNLTNHVRIEPEFNYYFKHDHVSFWDLGVNFHYLFPVAADVAIYPAVGLGYANAKVHFDEYSASDGKFQAKFGVGADFKLGSAWKLNIEPKYQLVDGFDQFIINVGLAFVSLLTYTFMAIACGFLLGSTGFNEMAMNGFVNVFALLVMFTSGMSFPVDMMPDPMITIGKLLPGWWFCTSIDQVFGIGTAASTGVNIGLWASSIGLLALFGVTFICLGLTFGRIRRTRPTLASPATTQLAK